jgi:hypothetical protein
LVDDNSAIDSATRFNKTSTLSFNILFSSCNTSTCFRTFWAAPDDVVPPRLSAPARERR